MKIVQTRFGLFVLMFVLLIIPMELMAEEIPTLYRGIRPLGMGGAFTAVSDDVNGLFYNPAGLHTKLVSVDILNPQLEVSKDSESLLGDISDLEGGDTAEIVDFMQGLVGEHQHLRGAFLPNVMIRNFGIAILAQGTADLEVRNPVLPEAITEVKLDLGLIGGGSFKILPGLQVGLNAKFIQRKGIKRTYDAVDIALGDFEPLDDLENKSDFAFDLGGMVHMGEFLSPVNFLDPTLGINIQNITDLDFEELGEFPMQVNLGAAIHPNFWIIQSTIAVDLMDVALAIGEDDDYSKRFHFGAELKFPMILAVRVGINQRFVTAGFTADLWILKLEAATYAEEVGAYAGQRDDRRYVAMLSLGF